MSIRKKSLVLIASAALAGFFASCADVAPPAGMNQEDCVLIFGDIPQCAIDGGSDLATGSSDSKDDESSDSSDGEDSSSSSTEGDDSESSSDSEGENEGSSSDSSGDSDSPESSDSQGGEDNPLNSSGSGEGEAGKDVIINGNDVNVGTDGMESVDQDKSDELDDLKNQIDNNQNPDGFDKLDKPVIGGGDLDFDNKEYYCFTGEGEWLKISYDKLKESGLPFLWNEHAWGLRDKYELRFEDACDAIYVQQKK